VSKLLMTRPRKMGLPNRSDVENPRRRASASISICSESAIKVSISVSGSASGTGAGGEGLGDAGAVALIEAITCAAGLKVGGERAEATERAWGGALRG
jgi:hypothetical protein